MRGVVSAPRCWDGQANKEEPSFTSFNAVGARDGQLETYPIGPVSTFLESFYAFRQDEIVRKINV